MTVKSKWNLVFVLLGFFPPFNQALCPTVTCDTEFSALNYSITQVICPTNCWKQHSTLCGVGVYSAGPVCLAAMQEQLIDVSGGLVHVYKTLNSSHVVESTRNGVTSQSCARRDRHYSFKMTCSTDGDTQYPITEVNCPPGCQGQTYPCGTNAYHVNSSVCAAARQSGLKSRSRVTVYKYTNGSNIYIANSTNECSARSWYVFSDINACSYGNPCQNQGTCVDLLGGYACICSKRFTGALCEQAISLKVVCEYQTALVQCPGSLKISVIDGFYGRNDYSTCPGNVFTLDCVRAGTLTTLKSICDGQNSCTLRGDNGVFGDPCPQTNKYIKMYYQCV